MLRDPSPSSKMSGTVKDIVSKAELDNLRQSGAPVVLHFWASWCDASKQMDQVFSHLATDFPRAHFFRVRLCSLDQFKILSLSMRFLTVIGFIFLG